MASKKLAKYFLQIYKYMEEKTLALNHLQWIERMNLFTCTMCAYPFNQQYYRRESTSNCSFQFLVVSFDSIEECLKIENSNWKSESLQGK